MDDARLLQAFESTELPFQEWTHEAHLRVAYLYLSKHGFEEGLPRLRSGIKRYNAAHEVPEGPTSGYNETTTVAFARIVDTIRRAYAEAIPTSDSTSFVEAHPQLQNKHILRFFYSPAQRLKPEAKHSFVEPDLAPLPQLPDSIEN